MKFKQYLNEMGFKEYPKGWDRESVKKFVKTLSKSIGKEPDEKGWFDVCVAKMQDQMGEGSAGFCSSCKDEFFGHTKWRSGDYVQENTLEDISKAKELIKHYIKKHGRNSKKIRQDILDNVVNSKYTKASNNFVDAIWIEFNKIFSS